MKDRPDPTTVDLDSRHHIDHKSEDVTGASATAGEASEGEAEDRKNRDFESSETVTPDIKQVKQETLPSPNFPNCIDDYDIDVAVLRMRVANCGRAIFI